MAEEDPSADDRTEDATPERREEFRERGQVAVSREVSSVLVLATAVGFMTIAWPYMMSRTERILVTAFQSMSSFRISPNNVMAYSSDMWKTFLMMCLPIFAATSVVAAFGTLFQTRFNWAWKRITPDFNRMNPLTGVLRMVDIHAAVELFKGIAKMTLVAIAGYLILYSEWGQVPGLMNAAIPNTWGYWGVITKYLFWTVAGLLVFLALLDYTYNAITLERRIKMTRQEVKEEFKRREVDPHVKARIRRLQRDVATRKMLDQTKKATVVVTNPTHYSVALRYDIGMNAPIVVAKGVDFLALRIREIAQSHDVPLVENAPLARTLYKVVNVDQEIPDTLYKAVSEIIRYVFQVRGFSLRRNRG